MNRVFSKLIGGSFRLAAAALAASLCSCSQEVSNEHAQSPHELTAHTAGLHTPVPADSAAVERPGVHNIVAFHEGFYSGSAPEGDAGFDSLANMGVKTIISVDGAEPEIELARARGMRYIHLPIGYDGFDEQRKLELVRATRDAMERGPVYIHCHHGKHRSGGAAGTIAVSLGWLTPELAVQRMRVSGTAEDYRGLYACTERAAQLAPESIDAVSPDFPEISRTTDFVKAMVEIDEVQEHLKAIEKSGWMTPLNHPDLVPAAEAKRMAAMFSVLIGGEKCAGLPAEFTTLLASGRDAAAELERQLSRESVDPALLSGHLKALSASCKTCHAAYRD